MNLPGTHADDLVQAQLSAQAAGEKIGILKERLRIALLLAKAANAKLDEGDTEGGRALHEIATALERELQPTVKEMA